MKSIAADYMLEKAHRVNQTYAGLALDKLRSKHRHRLLTEFGKVNAVFAGYTLNSFDDYKKIRDSDLKGIIRIVSAITPPKTK